MWRKESRGASSTDSLSPMRKDAFTVPSADSPVANANGLESQQPRPATLKLLNEPPASAAQRWLTNEVPISGFYVRGKILPPAGALGD